VNWIAYMKDGSIVKETTEFPFSDLDLGNVEKFKITETGSNLAIPFACDSGIIRFTNLDLRKLRRLEDKSKLTFEFDSEKGFFKMDEESLKRYETIMVDDENTYYFIEFDQTGVFNINGEKLWCGFELVDGTMVEFKNQPPYNKIIQYKNGMSEVRMRNNTPVQKNDKTLNYIVGYKKVHRHEDIEFSLHYEIVYDLLNRYVMLNLIMQTNKELPGKIFFSYGDKTAKIPIKLTANSPMQTKRVLSVIG